MSNSNESMALAYEAAYRAVGLTGAETHACRRYRAAVDAALEVLRPAIGAEALRMVAVARTVAGEDVPEQREQIRRMAMAAYYMAGAAAGREARVMAAVDAVAPLISADALREAADASNTVPYGVYGIGDETWRGWLRERAERIEKGEVRDDN